MCPSCAKEEKYEISKKGKMEKAARSLTKRVEYQDLLFSLAQAGKGLNIGQLLRGGMRETEAVARLFLVVAPGK